jgi:hypothetical protein
MIYSSVSMFSASFDPFSSLVTFDTPAPSPPLPFPFGASASLSANFDARFLAFCSF